MISILIHPVADLLGSRGTRVPNLWAKFFQFHRVSKKHWSNSRLATSLGVGAAIAYDYKSSKRCIEFLPTGTSLPKLPTSGPTTEGDISGRRVPVAKEPDDVSRSLPNISTPDTSSSEQVVPSMKPREHINRCLISYNHANVRISTAQWCVYIARTDIYTEIETYKKWVV